MLVFPNGPCTYNSPPFQNICYTIGTKNTDGVVINTTIIDSVQAQVFEYNNSLMYNKIAYFSYSGFNWAIYLSSYVEFTEEMDSYFSHVVSTFKFIEWNGNVCPFVTSIFTCPLVPQASSSESLSASILISLPVKAGIQ